MPEADLAVPRAQLTEERDHLLAQLAHMGRGPGTEELKFDEGFADSGQVTAERGEVDALAGKLLANLAEIDDALVKIEAGTYGRCEDCGDSIPEARLEAMASARYCITCVSKRR